MKEVCPREEGGRVGGVMARRREGYPPSRPPTGRSGVNRQAGWLVGYQEADIEDRL